MSCRSPGCDIVAASFSIISLIISGGVACFARRCPSRLVVSSPALSSFRPSSHRCHFISARFPSRPALLLGLARRLCPSVISLVISGNSACLPPLVSSPVSPLDPFPLGDAVAALPNRPRAVRLAVIDRPALLVGWLGAGRDGIASLAIACPPCRRCLLWDGVSPACVSSFAVCSACSCAAIYVCIVMAKLYI